MSMIDEISAHLAAQQHVKRYRAQIAERQRLKQMLMLAKELPESTTKDAVIHRIEVELLYQKLSLNVDYY